MEFNVEVDEISTAGRYLNLKEEGSYKLRILGDKTCRVQGYEAWNEDRQPMRTTNLKEAREWNDNDGGSVKVFWALTVWNYNEEKVQVWQFSQKSIKDALTELTNNEDYGDLTKFDITVTRKGTGMNNTSYTVMPSPEKPLPEEAREDFSTLNINLMNLFEEDAPVIEEGAEHDPNKLPF